MHRLTGKFAMFFTGAYLLVVFGVVFSAATGRPAPLLTWLLLSLPAIAFTPAVIVAVRLHRTSDLDQTRALWRRCALFAVAGLALLAVIAVMFDKAYAA